MTRCVPHRRPWQRLRLAVGDERKHAPHRHRHRRNPAAGDFPARFDQRVMSTQTQKIPNMIGRLQVNEGTPDLNDMIFSVAGRQREPQTRAADRSLVFQKKRVNIKDEKRNVQRRTLNIAAERTTEQTLGICREQETNSRFGCK